MPNEAYIIKYIKDLLACQKIKPKNSRKIDALSPIDQYDHTNKELCCRDHEINIIEKHCPQLKSVLWVGIEMKALKKITHFH